MSDTGDNNDDDDDVLIPRSAVEPPPTDEFSTELALRFAAAFVSLQMRTSYNTAYRTLRGEPAGDLWQTLARFAVEQIRNNFARLPQSGTGGVQ